MYIAEDVGLEPTKLLHLLVFKTSSSSSRMPSNYVGADGLEPSIRADYRIYSPAPFPAVRHSQIPAKLLAVNCFLLVRDFFVAGGGNDPPSKRLMRPFGSPDLPAIY